MSEEDIQAGYNEYLDEFGEPDEHRMALEEAEKVLMEKGVYPEFRTGSIVMCLTGIGNVREDYELLLEALAEIAGK